MENIEYKVMWLNMICSVLIPMAFEFVTFQPTNRGMKTHHQKHIC